MYYCIVNPSSRSGKGKSIWNKLEQLFKEANIEYKALYTKGPGHATELVHELTDKSKSDRVLPIRLVVLGGDGSLNEAINGIDDFENTYVGYIPTGSSNDFSRDLSYPKNVSILIKRILEGKVVRTLDIGKVTYNSMTKPMSRLHDDNIKSSRLFDVSCGIGFDAGVCEEALSSGTKNFLNKIGLGKLTYGAIAVRQLLKADKIPCDIIFEDGTTKHFKRFILIAAMIHHYEGGGFKFAPKADLCDGKFDIVAAHDMSKYKMFPALPFAFFGHHFWIKGIDHYLVSKITIRTQLPMWVHTDGEVSVKSDNITLECFKEKLKMIS